jgi:hypothetical protein
MIVMMTIVVQVLMIYNDCCMSSVEQSSFAQNEPHDSAATTLCDLRETLDDFSPFLGGAKQLCPERIRRQCLTALSTDSFWAKLLCSTEEWAKIIQRLPQIAKCCSRTVVWLILGEAALLQCSRL